MNETAAPTFFPFLMLLVFFLFVYFVTIRPQQKRKRGQGHQQPHALKLKISRGHCAPSRRASAARVAGVPRPRSLIARARSTPLPEAKDITSQLVIR